MCERASGLLFIKLEVLATVFVHRFQFVTLRFASEAPGNFVSSFALVDCIGLDLRSHFDKRRVERDSRPLWSP